MANKTLTPATSLCAKFIPVLVLLLTLIVPAELFGIARTWTNGGGNNNWHTAANWAPAGVPTAADDLTFDGTSSANCNLSAAGLALSINITAGYTGTISQGANTITVGTGGITMAGGAFAGGNQLIDVSGNFSLSGGTYTSTMDTLLLREDYSFTGGTFNHNNGVVSFLVNTPIGAPVSTITGSTNFHTCKFAVTVGVVTATLTHTGTSISTVEENFILDLQSNSALQLDGNEMNLQGDVFLNPLGATSPNPGGLGTTILKINGSGTQNLFGNIVYGRGKLPEVWVDKSPTDSLIVYGVPTMGQDFNHVDGIIHTIGTLGFEGGNQTRAITGTPFTLRKVRFSAGRFNIDPATVLTVDSLLDLSTSSPLLNLGDIILTGDFYTGCINRAGGGTANVIIQGSGTQRLTGNSIISGGSLPNVVINKAATDTLIIEGPQFVNVSGNLTYNDGIISGNGSMIFNGNSVTSFMQDIIINHPSGILRLPNSGMGPWSLANITERTVDIGKTVLVEGDFITDLGGSFNINGGTFEVLGDIICSNTGSNVTTGGNGTILISGTADQDFIGNSDIFSRLPNIVIDKPSGTLTLRDTIAVAGDWTYLRGDVDDNTFQSGVAFWSDSQTVDCVGATDSMFFYNLILGNTSTGATRTMLSNVIARNSIDLRINELNLNEFQFTLQNPSPLALTFSNISTFFGGFISETPPPQNYGYVRWNVGNSASGSYTIPFNAPNVTFTRVLFQFDITAAGVQSGDGAIRVSTYGTDWTANPNNQPLPFTVTNLNNVFGIDNSAKMVDRFWTVEAIDYSTVPTTEKGFGYYEREAALATNIISQFKLQEHLWNASGPSWVIPPGTSTADSTNNIVTTVGTTDYGIYTLVDPSPPDLVISSSDSTICVGQSIDFFDENSTTPTSSTWTFPGGTPGTASVTDPTGITYNTAGTYDVILWANYSGNIVRDTFFDFITVSNGPNLVLDSSQITCNGAADGKIWATPSNGANYQITWTSGGTVIGPIDDTIINLAAGTYTVELIDTANCVVFDTASVSEPAAITGVIDSTSVICFGGGGGKAWITASGGTTAGSGPAAYSYAWADASNNPVASVSVAGDTALNLTPGTYFVTVTDDNNCEYVDSLTLLGPTAGIAIVLDSNSVLCNGDSSGKVWATVSGGTPPFSYTWSKGTPVGPVNDTVNDVWAGVIVVDVEDANGCTASDSITILEPTAINTSITGTDALCNGASSGTATVVATGGTPTGPGAGGYTYTWSAGTPVGPNNETVNDLPAGTHTVIVTDGNGCEAFDTVLIGEPTAISLVMDFDSVQCFGGNDGKAWVTATGGTPATPGPAGYTYSWSAGVTTGVDDTTTILQAGWVIVTVTDNNSCTAIDSIFVGEPASAITIAKDSLNVVCFNGSDGWATVSVTGGTPSQAGAAGYTYQWTDAANNPVATLSADGDTALNLTGGQYTVVVTDSRGCTDSVNFDIQTPTAGVSVVFDSSDVTCAGINDGKLWATASGGTPSGPGPSGYNYTWSGGTPVLPDEDTITGLSTGVFYSVTVTDANGCSVVDSATVGAPSSVTATAVATDVLCFGDTTGVIAVTATGGTPSGPGAAGYTYSWTDGSNNPLPTSNVNSVGDSAFNLGADTYTVRVTDANGCFFDLTDSITQPDELIVAMDSTAVSCNGGADGKIYVTVTGGTAGYTINWSSGTPTGPNNDTITGLTAGCYFVTVTDANGCEVLDTACISEPLALALPMDSLEVSCFGGNDGKVWVTPTGGTAPYTISWSATGTPTGPDNDTLSGLVAGCYTVTVTDNNGCIDSATACISEPSELVLAMDSVGISCADSADGIITVVPSGGTGPYVITWSGGTPTGPNNDSIINLVAGCYFVTVTDANGCVATDSACVSAPPAITLTFDVTDVLCGGDTNGIIVVTAAGGNPVPANNTGYTYQWDAGVTITGAGDTAINLAAGIYPVTVTDANGCPSVDSATVNEPLPIVLTADSTEVSCFGGSDGKVWVTPTGGDGNYTVTWPAIGTPTGPINDTLTGLPAGCYTAVVTDGNACSDSIIICISEPTELVLALDSIEVSCFDSLDGSVWVVASGGTPPYSYSWNTGSTNDTISGLGAGCYIVTVTDSLGCVAIDSACISEPTAIALAFDSIQVSCFGFNDGRIWVDVTGGTPNGSAPAYNVSWTGPAGNPSPTTGVTNDTIIDLIAGTYIVTVTDANGCTIVDSASISQPDTLALTLDSTNVLCFGDTNGTITVTATGGTPPYTYTWPAGVTTAGVGDTAINLPAGCYTVTVSDFNGCVTIDSTCVIEPALLTTAMDSIEVSCFGGADGKIWVTPGGGTSPYTITWSGGTPAGAINDTITGLTAGCYFVTVEDANGCIALDTACISEPTELTLVMDSVGVSCFGGSDGIIWVTPTGGTGPYSYDWSNGGTSDTIAGLPAGCYTVIVTDANGCIATDSACVSAPDTISLAFDVDSVLCAGDTNGRIIVTPTGGLAPYTYVWPVGVTTLGAGDTAINLAAGCYAVTVTDFNGCQLVDSTCVFEPDSLLLTLDSTDVLCAGDTNGLITVVPTGGTAPYTYAWPAGVTTNVTGDSAINLAAGCYAVTVTDVNGCTTIDSTCVIEPTLLTTAMDSTGVSCFGGNDGSIWVTAGGGTAPYTYNWSGGTPSANGDTINGLTAGCYFVTLTDANGCETLDTACISEPAELIITLDSVDVSCNGGADGIIWVTATGGTGPYTYDWSNGGTNDTISGLPAGCYTVIVTDANGCTATDSACVVEPTAITTAMDGVNILCNGDTNGLAWVVATGGTPSGAGAAGYTYSWTGPAANPTPTTNTVGDSIFDLSAGWYFVDVTDFNGCVVTDSIEITEPPVIALTFDATDILCNGDSTGQLVVTATGGTPFSAGGAAAYTYAWSGPATNPTPQTGVSNDTIVNLVAGFYTVTVTDSTNCIMVDSFEIVEPALPLTLAGDSTGVSCAGGSDGVVWVTASGGTAPYNYSWTPIGVGTPSANGDTLSGLPAGCYTVLVTDDNGCTDSLTICISEPLPVTIATDSINVDCNGAATGVAWVTVSGGTPAAAGYQYSWTGPAGNPTPQTGVTADTIVGLIAGQYDVTVTDSLGCTETATIVIEEPTAISITPDSNNVTCNGLTDGKAWVNVTGGTPASSGYVITWSGSVTTNNDTAINLAAGSYTAVVTDSLGCTDSVTITITEPDPLVLTIDSTNVLCFGDATGSAWVTVTGGTPTYSYVWTGPAANPTPQTGVTNDTIINLVAGTYTVLVTDDNGCSDSLSVTITEPATAISLTTDSSNVSCFGGADGRAWVTPTGGTPSTPGPAGYTYQWLPAGSGTPSANGDTLSGLSAGVYSVVVTDDNGCTDTASFNVTEPAAPVSVVKDSINVFCNGDSTGKAWVTASGGTPFSAGGAAGYTYSWSAGTVAGAAGDSIINLQAGTYRVTVTDSLGCELIEVFNITEPAPISVTTSQTNVSCFAGNDGVARVVVSGGTPNATPPLYTITWSGGTVSTNGDSTTQLSAGTYRVTVEDALGCQVIDSVTITEPSAPLEVTLDSIDVNCFGGNDGRAWLTATGGTPQYSYSWSGGTAIGAGDTIINLTADTYDVTLTDANGCTVVGSIVVNEPAAPLSVVMDQEDVSCNGAGDGKAWATVSGGTPAYTYAWSGGTPSANGDTTSGLVPGTYFVTVTDANGCTILDQVTITEPDELLLSIVVDSNTNCYGGATGGLTVSLTGGTGPYDYVWSNGAGQTLGSADTENSVAGLTVGQYIVTVTDANGCQEQISEVIIERPGPQYQGAMVDSTICNEANGTISVSFTTVDPPLNYAWSHDATLNSQTVTGLAVGSYTVTVSDASQCDTVLTLEVLPIDGPEFDTVVVKNSFCERNDGAVTVQMVQGTAPYEYFWSHDTELATNNATELEPGSYTVTVIDATGCFVDTTVNITDTDAPELTVDPLPQQVIFNGQELEVTASLVEPIDSINYVWTPDEDVTCLDDECLNVNLSPAISTTFLLVATDIATGCTDTLYYNVVVRDEENIFIPNAITPNGDGVNDVWIVRDLETFPDHEVIIINRWGDEVFRASPYLNDWGGTNKGGAELPAGTYYYIIKLNEIDESVTGPMTIIK